MKYVDEFRDPVKAAGLIQQIEQLSIRISEKRQKVTKIMEVCGGHTHS
ncbi:MAG: hydrogenase formation protein HypD, partial [Microcystis sp.]